MIEFVAGFGYAVFVIVIGAALFIATPYNYGKYPRWYTPVGLAAIFLIIFGIPATHLIDELSGALAFLVGLGVLGLLSKVKPQ